MFKALVLGTLLASSASLAAPALNQRPATVELKGDSGGKVDGSPWSSDSIKGKVFSLFYVDPDHRDMNEHLKEALASENFPLDRYGSIAVINMGATWVPNALIGSSLKSNQEKYPDTVYVKDFDKALVKQWQLADDAYDVLVLDKEGKIIFSREGDFSKDDVATMIKLIRDNL